MKQKQKQKNKFPLTPVNKGNKHPSSTDTKRRLTLALIIGIFGILLYSNTLSNGYVLDDFSAIKENNIVRQGIHSIPEIFKTSYRQGYLSIKDGLYRPLSLATYAIEWNYFPDKPGVSHFVNIILYGITGMMLFFFLCRLSPFGGNFGGGNELFAFITSLLFIAHPLHVEVVANIKSRDEMLCFLFVICSFIFVFRFIENRKKKFLAYSLLTYFLSLFSKETSITFLALLPLAVHFFTPASIRKNVSITSFFVGTAVIYLLIRHSVLQGFSDTGVSMADNIIAGTKTFSTHIGTSFYILGLYIMKLISPHPLSYDYSFNQIPIVDMGNVLSIISLLFYLAIGSYSAFILFKSFKENHESGGRNQELKCISFGILFFLITIFIFSNLVLIIGTSMGDRLMYFPSLGFCICIAVLYIKYFMKDNPKLEVGNWKLYPLAVVLILFSYKTYSRNPDWKDNYTLYSHDVNIIPNSVKAHYYLGLELVKVIANAEPDAEKKKKIYEEGIAELEKAVKIHPTFASAYTQMGVAYYRMKNYEKAIVNYNKAAELSPSDAITLNNIGTVYFEWGKYSEAKEKFQQAVQIDPRFIDANMNLGSVLGTIKDFNGAIVSFQNAIKYAPDNARAYFFIAITYQNMGDKVNADKYFQIAQQMDPKLKKQ
ncbi:MAG: tetratricopeptide repeat protein [Bacteroidetes bacterium]|nr:tetratricopeptide repeat protein [Bacteroidota bacterium]